MKGNGGTMEWIKNLVLVIALVSTAVGLPAMKVALDSAHAQIDRLQSRSHRQSTEQDRNRRQILRLENDVEGLQSVVDDIKKAIRHALR